MFSCTPEYTPLIKVIQNDSDQPDFKHGNRDRIKKSIRVSISKNHLRNLIGQIYVMKPRGDCDIDDIMLFLTLNWQQFFGCWSQNFDLYVPDMYVKVK